MGFESLWPWPLPTYRMAESSFLNSALRTCLGSGCLDLSLRHRSVSWVSSVMYLCLIFFNGKISKKKKKSGTNTGMEGNFSPLYFTSPLIINVNDPSTQKELPKDVTIFLSWILSYHPLVNWDLMMETRVQISKNKLEKILQPLWEIRLKLTNGRVRICKNMSSCWLAEI